MNKDTLCQPAGCRAEPLPLSRLLARLRFCLCFRHPCPLTHGGRFSPAVALVMCRQYLKLCVKHYSVPTQAIALLGGFPQSTPQGVSPLHFIFPQPAYIPDACVCACAADTFVSSLTGGCFSLSTACGPV